MKPVTADIGSFIELQNGVRLMVPLQDPYIGGYLACHGTWKPALEQKLVENIEKGDRVIEVGSSIGVFSLLIDKIVGSGGSLFMFEPSPFAFEYLTYNIIANMSWRRSSAYRLALADQSADMKLLCSENHLSGRLTTERRNGSQFDDAGLFLWADAPFQTPQARYVPVRTVTLNHVLGDAGAFDFLLIGAGGFDVGVLLGADRVITNSSALKILFEWDSETFHANYDFSAFTNLWKFLKKEGFMASFLDEEAEDEGWRPVRDPVVTAEAHGRGSFFLSRR